MWGVFQHMHILAENFLAYSLKKKVVKIERIAVYVSRAFLLQQTLRVSVFISIRHILSSRLIQ